jgi:diguanylate cyclase (GGDEF)-like protein
MPVESSNASSDRPHGAAERSGWRDRLRSVRAWLICKPSIPVLLLLLLGAGIVGATILFAAQDQDRVALGEQIEATRALLSTEQRLLGLPNRDYAWSEDVLGFARAPDMDWARAHIGASLYNAYHIDVSVVIGRRDQVIVAFRDGHESGAAAVARITGGLHYLVAQARAVRGVAMPVTGLLEMDGKVAIAAATVVREARRFDLDSGVDPVLVFLRFMDGRLLAPVRQEFDLADLSVTSVEAVGDRSSVPLLGVDDSLLGALAWVPERPGRDMIARLFPPVGAAFLIMMLLAWWIARQSEAARAANQASLRVIASKNAELEKATELQATTWNAIDEGFIVIDRDLRIVSWNDTFVRMTRIPATVLRVGSPVEDVFRFLHASGDYVAPPTALDDRLDMLNRRDTKPVEYRTTDGHVIEVRQCRLPDGGLLISGMDITERRRAQERVAFLARHDALTNLWNRASFVERLGDALAVMRRGQGGLAVLYLDLDHFKDVNDTLGHPIGDALLQAVSKRLTATVRTVDVVARFGGDEFAILQTHVDDAAAVSATAERITKALEQPFEIEGNSIRIGTSIGICVPAHGPGDAEDIMGRADLALYEAKEERRGTYRFHESSMNEVVKYRVAIASDLHEALAKDELFLEYQPQVDLSDGKLIGLEALARWRHPERGVVPPSEFIPVAERCGLMPALGSWILRSALQQGRQWLDDGFPLPTIAVNISALQVRGWDFESELTKLLESTGFSSHLLELEITESIFFEATHARRDVLEHLRKLGIRIAIDDFGTGYSSLEYLRVFPADRLKVAGTFVKDLNGDSSNAALVTAAVSLGKAFGLTTIAEGVEDPADADFLRSLGCHQAQGFLYSQPISAAAVAALLRRPGGTLYDPATGRLAGSIEAVRARLDGLPPELLAAGDRTSDLPPPNVPDEGDIDIARERRIKAAG